MIDLSLTNVLENALGAGALALFFYLARETYKASKSLTKAVRRFNATVTSTLSFDGAFEAAKARLDAMNVFIGMFQFYSLVSLLLAMFFSLKGTARATEAATVGASWNIWLLFCISFMSFAAWQYLSSKVLDFAIQIEEARSISKEVTNAH